jgi:hypothetical protein
MTFVNATPGLSTFPGSLSSHVQGVLHQENGKNLNVA